MRECFCPYLGGPEICKRSILRRRKYYCLVPYGEAGGINARLDCPVIREHGVCKIKWKD
jgi:hypothetical protein